MRLLCLHLCLCNLLSIQCFAFIHRAHIGASASRILRVRSTPNAHPVHFSAVYAAVATRRQTALHARFKQYITRRTGKAKDVARPADSIQPAFKQPEAPSHLKFSGARRAPRLQMTEKEEDELLEPIRRYQPFYVAHRALSYRLGRLPTMSQWVEAVNVSKEELLKAQVACRKRMDEIIRNNRAYVAHIAQKFKSFEWQPEQLIEAGLEGFRHGLIEYKRAPGYNFIKFSHRFIKAAIGKHVTDTMDEALPDRLLRIKTKIDEAVRELAKNDTKGEFSDQMIADALGIPLMLYDKLVEKINTHHVVKSRQIAYATWRPGGSFQTEEDMFEFLDREKAKKLFKESQVEAAENVELLERPSVQIERILTAEELNAYNLLVRQNVDEQLTAAMMSLIHQVPEDYITTVLESAKTKIAAAQAALDKENPKPLVFDSSFEERPARGNLGFMRRRKQLLLSQIA